jgi:glycosyltransferase involved in cell wall biosynthesis
MPADIHSHTSTARLNLASMVRASYYNAYAQALNTCGLLGFYFLPTRRGPSEVPIERMRLNPWIGLWITASARALGTFRGESFRFRLLPWFDRWVLKQLEPGDHLISSYGYANQCFRFVRRHGGKTFVDAGNSHIEQFWEILVEEHRRWKCSYPPVSPYWYQRSREMLSEGVDYVLSPSSYVTKSFLDRGFKQEQILQNFYPVDLSLFHPSASPRPKNRPLTVINSGSLSLRKGTPYLLEAFRMVQRAVPNARLMLTSIRRDDVNEVLRKYSDLPIDWAPGLPQTALAERLRSADVFVLLSLEEGLVRAALEAMACGLPVVLTPNTGSSQFVKPGVNGEIVPIRDAAAAAEGVLKCWARIQEQKPHEIGDLHQQLSFEAFETTLRSHLRAIGLCPAQ